MTEAEVQMHKAILWEEAKGKMQAMVMAEAHRRLCDHMTVEREKTVVQRWINISGIIDRFIAEIENDGFHE